MVTRKVKAEDRSFMYAWVCDLEQTTFLKHNFEIAFGKILSPSTLQYWIAESESNPIGYFALRTEMQLHHCAPIAEIVEFYIAVENRNKRLGAEMLGELIKIAKQAECLWVEVASSNWREDAHRFYLSNGFEKTQERFGRRVD